MTLIVGYSEPDIAASAETLRNGGLVAFPTETVYGLGANALDSAAVARIFAAKGRPAGNPLIVHVTSVEQAQSLTSDWTHAAEALANRFWPGPLTLVVRKANHVPDVVTASGTTVALRMPAHPIARALLVKACLPIAAPSANRSMHVSPTTAAHVLDDLGGRIDVVIDGGPTPGGIESTVVDVTETPAVLLRPGLISRSQIASVVSLAAQAAEAATSRIASDVQVLARSPGQMARHYAPRVPLELTTRSPACLAAARLAEGHRVGVLTFDDDLMPATTGMTVRRLPRRTADYAAGLYAALRELESQADRIVVGLPPEEPDWLAIRDRLMRAATPANDSHRCL